MEYCICRVKNFLFLNYVACIILFLPYNLLILVKVYRFAL